MDIDDIILGAAAPAVGVFDSITSDDEPILDKNDTAQKVSNKNIAIKSDVDFRVRRMRKLKKALRETLGEDNFHIKKASGEDIPSFLVPAASLPMSTIRKIHKIDPVWQQQMRDLRNAPYYSQTDRDNAVLVDPVKRREEQANWLFDVVTHGKSSTTPGRVHILPRFLNRPDAYFSDDTATDAAIWANNGNMTPEQLKFVNKREHVRDAITSTLNNQAMSFLTVDSALETLVPNAHTDTGAYKARGWLQRVINNNPYTAADSKSRYDSMSFWDRYNRAIVPSGSDPEHYFNDLRHRNAIRAMDRRDSLFRNYAAVAADKSSRVLGWLAAMAALYSPYGRAAAVADGAYGAGRDLRRGNYGNAISNATSAVGAGLFGSASGLLQGIGFGTELGGGLIGRALSKLNRNQLTFDAAGHPFLRDRKTGNLFVQTESGALKPANKPKYVR